jgi:1,2-diacylglycerol 3-beta-galactosyltransferase
MPKSAVHSHHELVNELASDSTTTVTMLRKRRAPADSSDVATFIAQPSSLLLRVSLPPATTPSNSGGIRVRRRARAGARLQHILLAGIDNARRTWRGRQLRSLYAGAQLAGDFGGGRNGTSGGGGGSRGGSSGGAGPLMAAAVGTSAASTATSGATQKTRILMLISDTGGGHRASAQALEAAFEELYPGAVETVIVDFWTEIAGAPFDKFPEGYSFLAKNPPLWRCAWNYGRFPLTRRLTEEFSNMVGNRNFRNALSDFKPDLIVSVHPLTQFIPLRVLKSLPNKIPFVTVCTDLGGAHPTWFHPEVDMCFVPSDQVRIIARRCGLVDSQLRQFGLPVRPAFWNESRAKVDAKVDLGLDPARQTILIVGGGDGVGGVARIARAVADRLNATAASSPKPTAQIVVVCGKNQRLRVDLARTGWGEVPVRVEGFVSNMSEWMAASDLIVSKAGPGTIAEALIRGLPIVLSGFLPGQEAPNVQYVTDANVGAFSRDAETIAEIVLQWLANPKALAARSRRAQALGRPNATHEIVREIAEKLTPVVIERALEIQELAQLRQQEEKA